jgi:hypothetical protein
MRNEALKACHRLGYAICKQWSGYHRASLCGRPRCTASNDWASGSWHARSSVRWQSCMCEWHCSTASRSTGARQRCPCSLWHSCVWGWGHLVPLSTCATKPFGRTVGKHRLIGGIPTVQLLRLISNSARFGPLKTLETAQSGPAALCLRFLRPASGPSVWRRRGGSRWCAANCRPQRGGQGQPVGRNAHRALVCRR